VKKSRISADNRCFCSLEKIFSSRAMSKAVKIKIHKTTVKQFVVHGSETWLMTEMDMKRLNTWERKLLSGIEGGTWRTRTNRELWELCQDLGIVADIKKKKNWNG
jgi:hypothetical protein